MSSHIRITFENVPQQDPGATLEEVILIATTDYNREQNREAKTQEKEMKKAFSHVQMIAALQRHTLKSIKALKVNQVGNAGFAQSLGIVPKIV